MHFTTTPQRPVKLRNVQRREPCMDAIRMCVRHLIGNIIILALKMRTIQCSLVKASSMVSRVMSFFPTSRLRARSKPAGLL